MSTEETKNPKPIRLRVPFSFKSEADRPMRVCISVEDAERLTELLDRYVPPPLRFKRGDRVLVKPHSGHGGDFGLVIKVDDSETHCCYCVSPDADVMDFCWYGVNEVFDPECDEKKE